MRSTVLDGPGASTSAAGVRHDRAVGVALCWYGAQVTAYLMMSLGLPMDRATRHLMLTVGAGVGGALLCCALLISAVMITVRSGRSRSAVALGTQAAWAGTAGALAFLAGAILLYTTD
jgi:hypothetical protein